MYMYILCINKHLGIYIIQFSSSKDATFSYVERLYGYI